MRNEEALALFEKRGRAAGFLISTGRPKAVANAGEIIQMTVELYERHPHLQQRFDHIAMGFAWNFIAALEQYRFLAQSDAQRGIQL